MSVGLRTVMLTIVLAAGLAGVFYMGFSFAGEDSRGFIPSLEVVGDVQDPLVLRELDEDAFLIETVHLRDGTARAVSLEDLLRKAVPRSDDIDLLLVGDDGGTAVLSGVDLSGMRVALGEQYGWEVVNGEHPVSSHARMLREIVVIAGDLPPGEGIGLIDANSNLFRLSAGELHRGGYSVVMRQAGISSVAGDDEELAVSLFDRERIVDLEGFVDPSALDLALVVGDRGEVQLLRGDGRFLLDRNRISYAEGEDVLIEEVRGLVLDPPDRMITDVYRDAQQFLQEEEPVLLLLLDGLGYHQYVEAAEGGHAPFLRSLPQPEKALAAYPPVTPVNFAAALTGVTPDQSGVTRRGIRTAEVPTIFDLSLQLGRKATAILGSIGVIGLEIDPVLCVDKNSDGSTDDEIRDAALARFAGDYDLILVHFKDIDRAGHDHGAQAAETLEQITRIDGYVSDLVRAWDGQVIIFSDHGMHSTGEGGDHGVFRVEDMIIPYWTFDGGRIHE